MNGSQIDLDHFKQGHRFVVFSAPGKRACYTDEAHEAAAEANSLGKQAFAMKLFDRGRRLERLGTSASEHVADALRGKPGDEIRENPAPVQAPKPFHQWKVTATKQAADHGTYAKATHYDVISPEGKRGSLVPTHGVYRFVEQLAFFDPMEGFALTAEARKPAPRPALLPEPQQMGFRFNGRGSLTQPGLFNTQTAILDLPGVHAPLVRSHALKPRPAGVSVPLEGHGGRVLTGKPRLAEDGAVVVRAKDPKTGKLIEIPVPAGAPDWRVDLATPPRELHGPLVPAPIAIAKGSVQRGVSIYPLGTRRDESGNPVGEARMPTGDLIEYAWRVVPLADLIVSHDPWDLTTNPAYPQVLQPRDRSRSSYADQINRLVREFDPQLLTWSATAADGAPIVGPDLVVESGNGRTMALSRIYREGTAKADAYKTTIAAWAQHLGLPEDQIARIAAVKDPVLVRLRLTDVDRAAFAREANVSGQQGMAAAEQAISDSAALTPALVGKLDPASDLSAAVNQGFVSEYIEQVAGRQARGTMADLRGKLSLAGETRIRYALFAFAYGPASHSLLPEIAEFRDSDLTAFLRGMMMAAPTLARLQADIAEGIFDASYAVGASVSEAAHFVATARKDNAKIWTQFRQVSMFKLSDAAHCWLFAGFPKGERTSGPTLTAALLRYAVEVQQHPAGQMSFFESPPAQLELIGKAVAAVIADDEPPKGAAAVELGKRMPTAVAEALPAEWGAVMPVATVKPEPPPRVADSSPQEPKPATFSDPKHPRVTGQTVGTERMYTSIQRGELHHSTGIEGSPRPIRRFRLYDQNTHRPVHESTSFDGRAHYVHTGTEEHVFLDDPNIARPRIAVIGEETDESKRYGDGYMRGYHGKRRITSREADDKDVEWLDGYRDGLEDSKVDSKQKSDPPPKSEAVDTEADASPQSTAVVAEPWTMSPQQYQAVIGVKQPWMMEISEVQMSRMSKRELDKYRAQRAEEWQNSAMAKEQWRHLVESAYKSGKFDQQTPGAHRDAKTAISLMKARERETETSNRIAAAMEANQITSPDQVKPGDVVFSIMSGQYVTISKVNRLSVVFVTPNGKEMKQPLGAMMFRSPQEIQAEVSP